MSLEDNKLTDADIAAHGVRAQPDTLTGSADENKKVFDALIADVLQKKYNATLDQFKTFESNVTNWETAEAGRVTAEKGRVTAETARVTAETARATAETARKTAETARATAETARATAETSRAAAETTRQTNEAERIQNEAARKQAEAERADAEDKRNVWEAYDHAKTYAPGNKVVYQGSSFLCISESLGIYPTDAAHWRLIAAKGADGIGAGDMLAQVYDPQGKKQDVYAYADASARYFVLHITFDERLKGKVFTVLGGMFSHRGIVPDGLVAEVNATQPNTVYTITCGDDEVTVETTKHFGFYDVTLEVVPTFTNATWKQISLYSISGKIPRKWQVGDERDETLTTGETLTFQIYDFNHDPLADGSGYAGITIGMKNLMATIRAMNSTNTNVGSFTGSELYAWLTGELWNSLPSDLRAVIRPVTKYTSAGNKSTVVNAEKMKVFLFSEVELLGSVTYSAAGEGAQYPIFTDIASRIKYRSNGVGGKFTWWERSPYASTTNMFGLIAASGAGSAQGAINGSCINFGFCI